jgi:hypothetical protein
VRCVYLNVSKAEIPSRVMRSVGELGIGRTIESERWEGGRYRYHPSSLLSLEGMMIREVVQRCRFDPETNPPRER